VFGEVTNLITKKKRNLLTYLKFYHFVH